MYVILISDVEVNDAETLVTFGLFRKVGISDKDIEPIAIELSMDSKEFEDFRIRLSANVYRDGRILAGDLPFRPKTFDAIDYPLYMWMLNVVEKGAGDFLGGFVRAALHADSTNVGILYPALKQLQAKYPGYGQR